MRGFVRLLLGLVLAIVLYIMVHDVWWPIPTAMSGLFLLGAVTENSAILWLGGVEANATIQYRAKGSQEWKSARTEKYMYFEAEKTLSVEIENLDPSTSYEAAFAAKTLSFTTFPALAEPPVSHVTIASGSCSCLSIWPWNSLETGFSAILRMKPDMVFLLGDNVYTDLTESLGAYRVPFREAHRRVLTQPSVTKVLQSFPSYVMFDDHEIANDFEGGVNHPHARAGLAHYKAYWGSRNPKRPTNDRHLDYTFDHGSLFSAYVIETRLSVNATTGHIMGDEQVQRVKSWLQRGRDRKFVWMVLASPVSWSERDAHGNQFRKERAEILRYATDVLGLGNLIIVSGDTHFGAAYTYQRGRVFEVGASPFQGWPFWPEHTAQITPLDEDDVGEVNKFIHGGAFHVGKLVLNANRTARFELFSWPLLPGWDGKFAEPVVIDSWDMTQLPPT